MLSEDHSSQRVAPLCIAALAVVFGDIGTSPLYALQACFTGPNLAATPVHILGVLSLIFWSLVLVVLVKYVVVVLNADNRGEGGVLALTALVINTERASPRRKIYTALGILGAALFLADGAITPAITVLGAVEGLKLVGPGRIPVLPIAVVILTGLFLTQRYGKGLINRLLGPLMLGWFLVLAAMGVFWILREPQVLYALNPLYGLDLLMEHQVMALAVLGGVFLAVTGGEALYADMGHFGKTPIRIAWGLLVMPALVLNYLGEGALLIEHPTAVANPFFLMAPTLVLWPLIVFAIAAAAIASRSVIAGVFFVVTQALSLGLLPRVRVDRLYSGYAGQSYVPSANWILMVTSIGLTVGFGSAASLSWAYGLAVAGAMTIVTPMILSLIKSRGGQKSLPLLMLMFVLLLVDVTFLFANLTKLSDGGWLPLVAGLTIYWLMQTWQRGRASLMSRLSRDQKPVRDFLNDLKTDPPVRVAGTAIFLDARASGIPRALLNNLKFNRVLHERVLLLTVVTVEQPRVAQSQRLAVTIVGDGIIRLVAQLGFMEKPNIIEILREAESHGIAYLPEQTTFFLSREELMLGQRSDLTPLRRKAFMQMAANAQVKADFYGLPPNRVIEIGTRIEI